LHRLHGPAGARELVGDARQRGSAPRDGQHLVPARGERPSEDSPHTSGGTGDDGPTVVHAVDIRVSTRLSMDPLVQQTQRGRVLVREDAMILATLGVFAQLISADSKMTVGSPTVFARSAQNEPALAYDPMNPLVLAAGANDGIDRRPCDGSHCSG